MRGRAGLRGARPAGAGPPPPARAGLGRHDRESVGAPVGQDAMGERGDPPSRLVHIHAWAHAILRRRLRSRRTRPGGPGHLRIAVSVQAWPADHPLDAAVDEYPLLVVLAEESVPHRAALRLA